MVKSINELNIDALDDSEEEGNEENEETNLIDKLIEKGAVVKFKKEGEDEENE